MKTMKYKHILSLGMVLCAITACKKLVEIDNPKNQLVTSSVFADSTNANAAVLGIYSSMMQVGSFGFCSGGITLYPGLSADELYLSTNDPVGNQFFNNQILSNNNTNQSLWVYAYKFIYETNACLEGLAASSNISDIFKNSLTGEAKFLRAFVYFNLVNLYGGVPLITGTDYKGTRLAARSSAQDVYEQIISDLKSAQTLLPANSIVKQRANYYAATALLAKAYLYTGQYDLAVAEADKIISSGNFSLMTDLKSVFLSGSAETILNFLPVVPLRASWEGFYFVPSSATAKPKYVITNTLYNSFETGDLRKLNWIKKNTAWGQIYPFPYKYKVATTSAAPTEYPVIFRLAEIYLIRAEAKANTNDISGAAADLGLIRKRAGLQNTVASDKAALLLAIEKERQAELFCEWGNRWFDLKRTNRALTVLGSVKTNLNANGSLYPVPLSEINSNPNLSQNAGY